MSSARVQYTKRQTEYLAFIERYMTMMGVSPSEGDIAAFFNVAGSSAHQMVVTLEAKGALTSVPGRARSLQLGFFPHELPVVGWPRSPLRSLCKGPINQIYATAEIADFLVRRMLRSNTMDLLKIGPLHRISVATQDELEQLGADRVFIELVADYFGRLTGSLIGDKAENRRDHSLEPERVPVSTPKSVEELRAREISIQQQRKTDRRKAKPRVDPGQRELFD